jgi:pimeloyl-ACP methyl ester carboxylesterase
VTGTLKDWDVMDRLGEIKVPTLLVGGRYDECRPSHLEEMHRRIPLAARHHRGRLPSVLRRAASGIHYPG